MLEKIKALVNQIKSIFKKKKKQGVKQDTYCMTGLEFDKDYNKRYKGWAIPIEALYSTAINTVKVSADTGKYSISDTIMKHYGKVVTLQEQHFIVVPLKYWVKTK